jgi:hypothetical protein
MVTRQTLGWEPAHPGLIADFDNADYFTAPLAPQPRRKPHPRRRFP